MDADEGLDGEGLVQLDRTDVTPADAGPLQRGVSCLDWRVPEALRLDSLGPAAGDAGQR